MKSPFTKKYYYQYATKHINVTTIKIAMEDSKVNVTVGIITGNGFLTIELCMGLLLCAFLCGIIAKYQWYSFSLQLQTNKRLQVIHLIEDLVHYMRAKPDDYQLMFPYQEHDVVVTIMQEVNPNIEYQLLYIHAQWTMPMQKIYTHLVVPVSIIAHEIS